jgi:peptide/nickel transport system substrate-binding protein
MFSDKTPVLARDCVQSIQRWAKRNPMGNALMDRTNELVALDDKRLEFRLKKRFPILAYVLGSEGCFIMPERIARTDAFTQISEIVSSGPYVFLPGEFVSGSLAAYARNPLYTPRQEAPSMWAGGKVAHFDRVEFHIISDPGTAGAALAKGEVDWWENPIPDLLPQIRKNKDLRAEVIDPLGALGIIRFNHLHAPCNNVKFRRALLPAISQREFLEAYYGDLADELGRTHCGFFTEGSPYANDAGMEAMDGPRSLEAAKKLLAESGYKGEKMVLLTPTDQPNLFAACNVFADIATKIGINVDNQNMDWGTLISRRPSKAPPSQGGWSVFITTWAGLSTASPGNNQILRGNGEAATWFGWATMPKMEELRDAWFDAPSLDAQKQIARQMQTLAFEEVPGIPTGMWFTPTAYRANLTGLIKSGTPIMWGIRRV